MAVNFEVLKGLLIRYVKLRIRNGDCTERQLARLVGTSQPQLHNVLKGARPLKQALADRLLQHFQIGLLELVRDCQLCPRKCRKASQVSLDRADLPLLNELEPLADQRKSPGVEERFPGHNLRAG